MRSKGYKLNYCIICKMGKKLIISQSIMWAAAILVVSIVDEKQFAISMLVILATVSLMNLRKGK